MSCSKACWRGTENHCNKSGGHGSNRREREKVSWRRNFKKQGKKTSGGRSNMSWKKQKRKQCKNQSKNQLSRRPNLRKKAKSTDSATHMYTTKATRIWRSTCGLSWASSEARTWLTLSYSGSTNNSSTWMCLAPRFGSPLTLKIGDNAQLQYKQCSDSHRISFQRGTPRERPAICSWP